MRVGRPDILTLKTAFGSTPSRSSVHQLCVGLWPTAPSAVLKDANIRISMDGRGHRIDSVFIERLWCLLKYDCVYLHAFATGSEFGTGLTRSIACPAPIRPRRIVPLRPPATDIRSTIWRGIG